MTKMTSEEIDNLEAGPEANALVAEEVMEWKRGEGIGGDPIWLTDVTDWIPYINDHPLAWNPSTSISPAWEVIDKFNEEGKEWELVISKENCQISNMDCEGQFLSGWKHDDGFIVVDAPTVPLAICRFALKAVLNQDKISKED